MHCNPYTVRSVKADFGASRFSTIIANVKPHFPPLPNLLNSSTMRRSPTALQQWLQLHPKSSSINSATLSTRRNNTIAPTPATTQSFPTNRHNPPNSARPFHSSQCLQAVNRAPPAPATKQRLRHIKEGRTASGMPLWLNKDGIFLDSMSNWRQDIDEWLDERRRVLSKQYERAYYDGYLPRGVSRSGFARAAEGLARAAAHDRPAAHLIKKISSGKRFFLIGVGRWTNGFGFLVTDSGCRCEYHLSDRVLYFHRRSTFPSMDRLSLRFGWGAAPRGPDCCANTSSKSDAQP